VASNAAEGETVTLEELAPLLTTESSNEAVVLLLDLARPRCSPIAGKFEPDALGGLLREARRRGIATGTLGEPSDSVPVLDI
jgi:hypothetical protein